MDRTGSVLDVLIPNLQQTPRTVVPYRYLMRKRGGEREQFWPQKLVLRTGVLSHPVYGWVRTGADGPYGLSFGRFDPKSSTNTYDRCPLQISHEKVGCKEGSIYPGKSWF